MIDLKETLQSSLLELNSCHVDNLKGFCFGTLLQGGDLYGMHAIVTSGTRFDWRRVVTAGIFGAVVVAPTGHYWYE